MPLIFFVFLFHITLQEVSYAVYSNHGHVRDRRIRYGTAFVRANGRRFPSTAGQACIHCHQTQPSRGTHSGYRCHHPSRDH